MNKPYIVTERFWKYIESAAQKGAKIIIDDRYWYTNKIPLFESKMKLVKGVYYSDEAIPPAWACLIGKRRLTSPHNRLSKIQQILKLPSDGSLFDWKLINTTIINHGAASNPIGLELRKRIISANYYAR